jgi:predicted MFS family arabinose efflux permease
LNKCAAVEHGFVCCYLGPDARRPETPRRPPWHSLTPWMGAVFCSLHVTVRYGPYLSVAVRDGGRLEVIVGLWRNPAFVVFWSARTISFAGTGITMVVLPVLVFRLTGSPAAVAALTAIEIVPYVALGLLAGALADRLNRQTMMVVCDGIAALLLAAVPAAAVLHLLTVAQLFIVALGIGTVFVWFDAANFGSLPALVDRAQLPTAISLIASSGTVALLLGPPLGAFLVTVMAPPYVLGFDAASYVMSALLLASIRRPFRQPQHPPDRRERIRTDIAEGLRFLWHQPVIRTMTLSVFCACVSWGGTFGLLVVYANRALHMARVDTRLGLLYTAGEFGGLISFVAVPALLRNLAIGRLMAAFLAASAVALVLLSAAPSYGWALPLFCCYELVYMMVTSTGITVRQMLTPVHLQARVNTAGRLIAYGGQPVGAVLGGVLAEFLPIRLAFGLMAIAVAAGAGLAGWSCLGSGPLSAVSIAAPASPP